MQKLMRDLIAVSIKPNLTQLQNDADRPLMRSSNFHVVLLNKYNTSSRFVGYFDHIPGMEIREPRSLVTLFIDSIYFSRTVISTSLLQFQSSVSILPVAQSGVPRS